MNKNEKQKLEPKLRFPEFKDDNNWKCVEIETVGKVITGKTPPTSNDSLWNGGIQFVTPTDIVGDKYQRPVQRTVVKTSKMKVLPKGTIMFTCIASIGKMAISVYPCVTNQQINSIITNKGYYNEFIYYSLFRNVNKIKSDLSNTTVPIINKTDFSKIQISVTLNEKEQEKIADCLSSIDDLISDEEKKLSLLNDYKKGWMQKLFPAEGKTVPEWRFPEFRGSGEWETTSLGEICGVLNGVGFPIKMQGNSTGKYSFFKVSDISNAVMNNGGILLKAANCIDDNVLLKLRAKTIPRGTTVFAKIGEALRLNRRAITSEECLIDNNVIGVKAKPKKADDYFIFLLLQLIDLERYCGGVIPSVKKTVIEEIEVSFISDLKEQQKIADFISGLVRLIRKQTDKIEALKQHKTALMQGLFPSIEEVYK